MPDFSTGPKKLRGSAGWRVVGQINQEIVANYHLENCRRYRHASAHVKNIRLNMRDRLRKYQFDGFRKRTCGHCCLGEAAVGV